MRLILTTAISSVSLLLCACSGTGGAESTEVAVLAQRDAALNKAVAARDAKGIGEFYAAEAVLMPTAEPAVRGRAAIVEEWTHILSIPGFENANKLEGVRVSASGDMGYTYGSYRANMMGEDDKMTAEPGKWLTVWTREGGKWKIVMDTYNTDIPPPDHK